MVAFFQVSPPKNLYTSLLSPIHATRPAHLILLEFITRTILDKGYGSLSSLLCSFLHSPVISSLLGKTGVCETKFWGLKEHATGSVSWRMNAFGTEGAVTSQVVSRYAHIYSTQILRYASYKNKSSHSGTHWNTPFPDKAAIWTQITSVECLPRHWYRHIYCISINSAYTL